MVNPELFALTHDLAFKLADQLERHQTRVVFAESCTAGLVSALLGQVPGISNWLCGSAVTYQTGVKREWLRIDNSLLANHTPVSAEVTHKMAEQVLRITPSAQLSFAVTGHLEESATIQGCHAWVCAGGRDGNSILVGQSIKFELSAGNRLDRQWQAAHEVLKLAVEHMGVPPGERKSSANWRRICDQPADVSGPAGPV